MCFADWVKAWRTTFVWWRYGNISVSDKEDTFIFDNPSSGGSVDPVESWRGISRYRAGPPLQRWRRLPAPVSSPQWLCSGELSPVYSPPQRSPLSGPWPGTSSWRPLHQWRPAPRPPSPRILLTWCRGWWWWWCRCPEIDGRWPGHSRVLHTPDWEEKTRPGRRVAASPSSAWSPPAWISNSDGQHLSSLSPSLSYGNAGVVRHPGNLGAIRGEGDAVDPTSSTVRVGELRHQLGERHPGSPDCRTGFGLQIFDVSREYSDFVVRGAGGQQSRLVMVDLRGFLICLASGHPPHQSLSPS